MLVQCNRHLQVLVTAVAVRLQTRATASHVERLDPLLLLVCRPGLCMNSNDYHPQVHACIGPLCWQDPHYLLRRPCGAGDHEICRRFFAVLAERTALFNAIYVQQSPRIFSRRKRALASQSARHWINTPASTWLNMRLAVPASDTDCAATLQFLGICVRYLARSAKGGRTSSTVSQCAADCTKSGDKSMAYAAYIASELVASCALHVPISRNASLPRAVCANWSAKRIVYATRQESYSTLSQFNDLKFQHRDRCNHIAASLLNEL